MAFDPDQRPPDNPNAGYGFPGSSYGGPQNPYPENPYSYPYDGPYNQSGPGFPPPTGSPLPLGEAIRQLPAQWIRVISHPGAMTLAEESGKASWDILWVQLIISAVITAIFSFLINLEGFSTMTLPTSGSSGSDAGIITAMRSITSGLSFAELLLVPAFFFIYRNGHLLWVGESLWRSGTICNSGLYLFALPGAVGDHLVGLGPDPHRGRYHRIWHHHL